jgi:hypothetical protein
VTSIAGRAADNVKLSLNGSTTFAEAPHAASLDVTGD